MRIANDATQATYNGYDTANGWALFQVWHNSSNIPGHTAADYSASKYRNNAIYASRASTLSYGGGSAYLNHRSKELRTGTWSRWCAAFHTLFLDGHVQPMTPGQVNYITGTANDYQGCCCWFFY